MIGLLLVTVAITLAIEMKSLLIGEGAKPEHTTAIEKALSGTGGVNRIIHMKTLHLGPEELLVAAKLAVPAATSAAEVAGAIDDAEQRARSAVPGLTLVMYLEPDIDRAVAPTSSAEA
jgi:divalent metal cation (Fe/Co/Zn/Cd) transporter